MSNKSVKNCREVSFMSKWWNIFLQQSVQICFKTIFSRRILEENEPDYYSGKFFFLFFFRQTTECMRSGHFLQNY